MDASLLAALNKSHLTAGQTPADLIALVAQLEGVTLAAGAALFAAGDAADAAYLLTAGSLEIRSGDGVLLDTEQPGALIGEQALMPGGSALRSAAVVAAEACRLLRIDPETFRTLLQHNRAALEAESEARTHNRLHKQARPLRSLLDQGARRTWDDGAILFRQGDAPDGMHLVLGGQAEVAMEQGGELVHIATVYPGQCFGEIGVLNDAPRSATVVARNQLRTSFVSADQLRVMQASDPALETFLRSLLRSRELPRLGLVHQHTVVERGEVCVQTIFSLNDGRELVGVRTPGGHYSLSQSDAAVDDTVQLGSTTVSLDRDGRIVGFSDGGDYEDIGGLQVLALEGTPLSRQQRRTLNKAARAAAVLAPDAVVCRCLNIERHVLQAAIDEGMHTTKMLQQATGCGTGCGGCLRQIEPMLPGPDGETAAPVTVKLGPPQKAGGGVLGWLRSALGG